MSAVVRSDYDGSKKKSSRKKALGVESGQTLFPECCGNCRHLDLNNPVDGPMPGEFHVTRRLWCVRYPTNILKRATDRCGEFAKEV